MAERPPTIFDTARNVSMHVNAYLIPGRYEAMLREDGNPRPLTNSEKLISISARIAVLLPPVFVALGLVTQNSKLIEWGEVIAVAEAIAFGMTVINTHFGNFNP